MLLCCIKPTLSRKRGNALLPLLIIFAWQHFPPLSVCRSELQLISPKAFCKQVVCEVVALPTAPPLFWQPVQPAV